MVIFTHIRQSFAAAFFPRLSEWVAAAVIFGCGWTLSVNDDVMSSGPGPAYQFMLTMASQPTWAKICVGLGFLRLLVLLINGAWRRSPHLRSIAAIVSSFLWFQFTLSFSATLGFGFAFAAGFLAMDFLNIIRAAHDARTVDEAFSRSGRGGLT